MLHRDKGESRIGELSGEEYEREGKWVIWGVITSTKDHLKNHMESYYCRSFQKSVYENKLNGLTV